MTPAHDANSAKNAEICAPISRVTSMRPDGTVFHHLPEDAPRRFPSTEALEPGCYVENVHPCGRYDDYGLVLRAEAGADEPGEQGEVTVQYAIGGSVFGPSRNWRRTDRRPAWLARLQAA